MTYLAIETSCDDTCVALYDAQKGLLAHKVGRALENHQAYGGIMPEVASRDHQRLLMPLIKTLLEEHDLQGEDVTAIGYTAGPGLIGSLLVGASVARTLALSWHKPLYPIHHLEGHLLSVFLDNDPIDFPFTALLVSGGHSMFIEAQSLGVYRLLGQSVDDAVGEAFDKSARLMGLPYPGGPAIAKLAMHGDPNRFSLPRPMCDRPGFDMSFSGLKTAVVQAFHQCDPSDYPDLAASFQEAVVDTLYRKSDRVLKETHSPYFVVAGGVAANVSLRERLMHLPAKIIVPPLKFCMDNAAMIAKALYLRHSQGLKPSEQVATARWPLDAL